MVEAWDFASKHARGEEYDGNYTGLLQHAIKQLRENPDVCNLVGDYEELIT